MAELLRRSLLTRIALRAKRGVTALAQHAYLHLYAVPMLKLKGELSSGFSVARGHGAFLLLSEGSFIKLAFSPVAALDREFANHCRLRELRPDLADTLPSYRHVRAAGISALACERLGRIPAAEALVPAAGIYGRFRLNSPAGARLELADCPQISAGLRCIEAEFGAEIARVLQASTEAFLTRAQYTTGLAHGDFHSRNVMRDEAGGCRLIDLDCVRFSGICEFDALYFALEQEWSASGRLWTDILAECLIYQGRNIAPTMEAFAASWTTGLGVAFFLDRVGQDFANYGMRYEQRELALVIDAARNAVE